MNNNNNINNINNNNNNFNNKIKDTVYCLPRAKQFEKKLLTSLRKLLTFNTKLDREKKFPRQLTDINNTFPLFLNLLVIHLRIFILKSL